MLKAREQVLFLLPADNIAHHEIKITRRLIISSPPQRAARMCVCGCVCVCVCVCVCAGMWSGYWSREQVNWAKVKDCHRSQTPR